MSSFTELETAEQPLFSMDINEVQKMEDETVPASSTAAVKDELSQSFLSLASQDSARADHPYLCTSPPTGMPVDEQLLEDFDFDGLKTQDLSDWAPDLVVFVVNDNEMQAAMHFFKPHHTVDIKTFNGYVCTCPSMLIDKKPARVLLLQQSKAGSSESQALITGLLDAGIITRCFVAAGCAFGFDASKQTMGDVLVSTHILSYESVRQGEDKDGNLIDEDRNELKPVPDHAAKWFGNRKKNFNFRSGTDKVKVHPGIVLCGDKLIDSQTRKDKLAQLLNIKDGKIKTTPVVGGEMEGSGMANAFAFHDKSASPFVVLKGISDWGAKKDAPTGTGQESDAKAKKRTKALAQRKATYAALAFLVQAFTAVSKVLQFTKSHSKAAASSGQPLDIDSPALLAVCKRFAAAQLSLVTAQKEQVAAEEKRAKQQEEQDAILVTLRESEKYKQVRESMVKLQMELTEMDADALKDVKHEPVPDVDVASAEVELTNAEQAVLATWRAVSYPAERSVQFKDGKGAEWVVHRFDEKKGPYTPWKNKHKEVAAQFQQAIGNPELLEKITQACTIVQERAKIEPKEAPAKAKAPKRKIEPSSQKAEPAAAAASSAEEPASKRQATKKQAPAAPFLPCPEGPNWEKGAKPVFWLRFDTDGIPLSVVTTGAGGVGVRYDCTDLPNAEREQWRQAIAEKTGLGTLFNRFKHSNRWI